MILVKQAASRAHQVNIKMFLVRSSVNFVQNRPTLVAKVETRRALIVQRDGYQEKVATNVKRVALVPLVRVAKNVRRVTHGTVTMTTQPSVSSANLVRRRRQKDQHPVKSVMLVLMETRRDFARSVPLVTFKMEKENKW